MRRLLSDSQAIEAHQMICNGLSHKEVAEKFGVCRSTITQIATGKRYKRLCLPLVYSKKPIGENWKCSLAEKLAKGSKLNPESGCIEWQRNTSNKYGRISINGRSVTAHRAAYELAYGEIADGRFILHSCDNPRCVNVEHLREGSHLENMNDRTIRSRLAHSERSGMAKLNRSSVLYIMERMSEGESGSSVARTLGVAVSTVFSVWHGVTWNRVTGLSKPTPK